MHFNNMSNNTCNNIHEQSCVWITEKVLAFSDLNEYAGDGFKRTIQIYTEYRTSRIEM